MLSWLCATDLVGNLSGHHQCHPTLFDHHLRPPASPLGIRTDTNHSLDIRTDTNHSLLYSNNKPQRCMNFSGQKKDNPVADVSEHLEPKWPCVLPVEKGSYLYTGVTIVYSSDYGLSHVSEHRVAHGGGEDPAVHQLRDEVAVRDHAARQTVSETASCCHSQKASDEHNSVHKQPKSTQGP